MRDYDAIVQSDNPKAPLVSVTAAFMAGILLGMHFRCVPLILMGCGIGAAALLLIDKLGTDTKRLGLWGLMILWICLGWVRIAVWAAHSDVQVKAFLRDEPQSIQLHSIVSDEPVRVLKPHSGSLQTCTIRLLHIRSSEGWRSISGRLRATFEGHDLLQYGDEVLVEGMWSLVPSPGNPGQYDWRDSLARQHIYGLIRVKPFNVVVTIQHHRGNPWMAAIIYLRHRWERLIQDTFDRQESGLLLSLLLGERVSLDEQLKEAFVETGTIHLLVISGFNVGLVAGVFELLLRFVGIRWRLRLVLLGISLAGYCVLTGMQPPVARATIMAWMVLGAYALDRVISWPNTLAAAALVILWINPTQLFDPGFQLSFGAVLSLLVFTPRWKAWLESHMSIVRPSWLRRYLAISISATSAIWVGLSPVLAWYFHLISPVSMLANLLIAPLMSALVSVGTAVLMFGTVAGAIVRWSSEVLKLLLHATLLSVSWCHAIPCGYWFVGHFSWWFLPGYYGLLSISLASTQLKLTKGRLLLCWALGAALWGGSFWLVHVLESRWLRMDVLDIGRGDSAVIRTPQGRTIVVDAGTQDAGRFRLVPFLRFEGVTTVEALVLTHDDEDHIGGAIPLLKAIRVKQLFTNGQRAETMSAQAVRYLAAAQRIPETILSKGMTLKLEPGIDIRVLHPPNELLQAGVLKGNDTSVVLKVTKGRASILLTGDIEEGGLPCILHDKECLRSTVLKVPHHGSRLAQAGEQFFDAVQPMIAILSVGHIRHLPAPETVRALRQTNAVLYSTREDGAISLRLDGAHLEGQTFKSRRKLDVPEIS